MWPALKNPAFRKLWFATVSFGPRVAEHDNASQFRHKASLWLLFNTWTRCTVKLLDSSPACDAGCLHTVHLGAGRTKASDFEFGFACCARSAGICFTRAFGIWARPKEG
jgi:hypothetical protein